MKASRKHHNEVIFGHNLYRELCLQGGEWMRLGLLPLQQGFHFRT